jgi:hypothetical protein
MGDALFVAMEPPPIGRPSRVGISRGDADRDLCDTRSRRGVWRHVKARALVLGVALALSGGAASAEETNARAARELGVAQAKKGQLIEAIESLRLFLARVKEDDPDRAAAKAELEALEARVGSLDLALISPLFGVEVDVNGNRVLALALGRVTQVNPGKQVVSARAEGYEPFTKTVEVSEGKRVRVTIELKRATAHPVSLANRDAPPRSLAPGVAVAAAGLGTFGIGLGLALSGVLEGPGAPTRDGALSDGARIRLTVGDVICGTGLTLVVAGVVVLVVESSKKAPGPPKTQALRGTVSF